MIGDGAIGLLLAMVLAERGCRSVTLVGGRAARLALAREAGVARALNYHEMKGGLAAGLAAGVAARPFPVVLEASGSPAAMDACLDLVSPLGTVVVIGDYGTARASFPWNAVLHRQADDRRQQRERGRLARGPAARAPAAAGPAGHAPAARGALRRGHRPGEGARPVGDQDRAGVVRRIHGC